MRTLSKSKLLAYRQCAKRLWLEVHRPELREDSEATEESFKIGHEIGDIARKLFDPAGKGVLVDVEREGFNAAFARSTALLASAQPIFEAGFSSKGAIAFADIMLPVRKTGTRGWRMIEVKSSTSVKDYHHDDVAIQAFVARSAGVPLASIALAHIDSAWIYPGNENYKGLLKESDLTEEAFGRSDEVMGWITNAQVIVRKTNEPKIKTGSHCSYPYECGFLNYCKKQEPKAKYPVDWLPRIQAKALKALINDDGVIDLRHVPDELLNDRQLRVKAHTLSGLPFFDSVGAAAYLADYQLPAYFLDFETVQFAIPIWKGTRPYQQIPFQFSLHRLSRSGKVEHVSFLDLSGGDPSKALAEALIAACGERGPVFVYNAAFETARIRELSQRFPRWKKPLLAINKRIVDLLRVAEQFYYHPSQQGSWSIKSVLPAIAPDLRYDALDGVQDGGMAMDAYREAVSPSTPRARKEQIHEQLLAYCQLDTYAMVRIWQFFSVCRTKVRN